MITSSRRGSHYENGDVHDDSLGFVFQFYHLCFWILLFLRIFFCKKNSSKKMSNTKFSQSQSSEQCSLLLVT